MTWLVRGCRLRTVIVVSAASGSLAGLLRGTTASVPSIASGGVVPVPVVAALALVPALAVVWSWAGVGWEELAGSSWSSCILQSPAVVAALAPYALLAGVGGGLPGLLENGRDAVGLLGLAVIGAWIAGQRGAVLVPIASLTLMFLFGTGSGSTSPHPWAWILVDVGDLRSVVVGAATGLLGLALAPGLPARRALDAADR